ncbi:Protein cornichon like protein 4 [Trachymyrmex zeteki]|uniref:Protein cornichon like protein 4 n=1 Tax=Mycetomoellerius zeteki TaxID=64791 RepID=A0A151XCB2_9HYME|nr:Protein cornichon like protein 4 [Trachymyrmex zeteki]
MSLISDPFLFVITLFVTGCVLFLLVLPKLIGHTFVVFLLLIHGQFILTLANIPMTIWLFYEYFSVPSGNMGVYDPTEIHNRSKLKRYTRDCMIHLGYCIVFFFIYLYCMIVALLKGDPINRSDDIIDL